MTFIVEDGTGTIAGANSYGSVAGLDTYSADRGVTLSGNQAAKEAALVRSTDHLDLRWTYRGCKLLPESQPLQWPRQGVYIDGVYVEGLPVELVKACYELAQRALTADLAPDPTVDASGVAVVKSRDKVGPIEVEREFSGGTASSLFFPVYPEVNALLARITYRTGGRVYRA